MKASIISLALFLAGVAGCSRAPVPVRFDPYTLEEKAAMILVRRHVLQHGGFAPSYKELNYIHPHGSWEMLQRMFSAQPSGDQVGVTMQWRLGGNSGRHGYPRLFLPVHYLVGPHGVITVAPDFQRLAQLPGPESRWTLFRPHARR